MNELRRYFVWIEFYSLEVEVSVVDNVIITVLYTDVICVYIVDVIVLVV